ncbi:MAG: hypothetical protein KKH98_00775 [Spirochaetes bacterium]|nr:hypothetical protein [Spirochaetota bacterium]
MLHLAKVSIIKFKITVLIYFLLIPFLLHSVNTDLKKIELNEEYISINKKLLKSDIWYAFVESEWTIGLNFISNNILEIISTDNDYKYISYSFSYGNYSVNKNYIVIKDQGEKYIFKMANLRWNSGEKFDGISLIPNNYREFSREDENKDILNCFFYQQPIKQDYYDNFLKRFLTKVPEIREKAISIYKNSKGKKFLEINITDKPKKGENFKYKRNYLYLYIGYTMVNSYHSNSFQYKFIIHKKNKKILYYDKQKKEYININEWRKNNKSEFFDQPR